ncbi:Protein SOSEKI [Dillenia turbinata]|uniref:Protein SOSEKI n=1 Tax=Dillenia turbinata TaxID=194707 RepID=A0AAN8V6N5_9MAGN
MDNVRGRRNIDKEASSPDRANGNHYQQQQKQRLKKPLKKVQLVYYLYRNGQLEHPHYMELTHVSNQPLRLKDFIDRLTILRGKGMPSLYSWSCKRSYKNGYVWNDLSVNDMIYPSESDGAEYVLKGSELIPPPASSSTIERNMVNHHRQQLLGSTNINRQSQMPPEEPNILQPHPKRTPLNTKRQPSSPSPSSSTSSLEPDGSTTPQSRCSRGVSTDEIEQYNDHDHDHLTSSDKQNQVSDSPPPCRGRGNSVLLQLIACGNNNNNNKCKNKATPPPPPTILQKQERKSEDLRKSVVCRSLRDLKDQEEEEMINYMSENPRFGNLQSEEKEYFSGSIVEVVNLEDYQPVLKKSSSYNDERSAASLSH